METLAFESIFVILQKFFGDINGDKDVRWFLPNPNCGQTVYDTNGFLIILYRFSGKKKKKDF